MPDLLPWSTTTAGTASDLSVTVHAGNYLVRPLTTSGSSAVTFTGCYTSPNSTAGIWVGDRRPLECSVPASPEELRRGRRLAGIRRAKTVLAGLRARSLLESLLSDVERAELAAHGRVTVRTGHGRRYRLDAGRRGHNAVELDRRGRPVREFCVCAPFDVPLDDHVAAQVLMLRAEPDEFDRLANVWELAGGRRFVSASGEPLAVAA